MIQVDTHDGLQAVFDRACPGDVIHLAEGEYRVKATISTPELTLVGAGADRTRIVWDDYAKKLDETGLEYNTFSSVGGAALGAPPYRHQPRYGKHGPARGPAPTIIYSPCHRRGNTQKNKEETP